MRQPKWLSLVVICTLCWGVWGYLVKIGSDAMSPQAMQILFVIGMVPLLVAALARTRLAVDRDRRGVTYGILNGVLATFGMLAFYAAMGRGKASIIGPMTSLFPLFTVLGAVLVLKEKMNRVQLMGIVVGLVAVAILSR